MVTSKDVAKAANVSVSTVSRVFSKPDLVNKKTAKIVREVAAQLNYFPDITAKSLKLNKTNIIGMVISDINNPFYLHILNHMSTKFENSEYRFIVSFSEEKSNIEFDCITSLISSKVEALIFTPTGDSSERIESIILDNKISSLQLFRKKYDNLDSLIIDDEYGTYLATKELIKNGHTNIVLLDYDISIPTNRDLGYKKAFSEFNLQYNLDNIIKFKVNSDFKSDLFKKLDFINPTAVIPTSNIFADSIFSYLKLHNKKIKEDISRIIYDDIEIAEYLNISVISHPLNVIADTSINIIKHRINNVDSRPQHITIKPFLIKRDSIKRIS